MNRGIDRHIPRCGAAGLPVIMAALLVCGFVCSGNRTCRAAGDGPDKASVQQLLDELDDIDIVRSINPLKLTADQIDKLVKTISDAKTAYDKKIADLSAATVGAMAEEIHKRHKASIDGGDPSGAFDEKVRKMMASYYAKRDDINYDNLVSMTASCGKILTPEQHKVAVDLEKSSMLKNKQKVDASEPDSKYFNLYVADVFIGYHRIVPLLKLIKPA